MIECKILPAVLIALSRIGKFHIPDFKDHFFPVFQLAGGIAECRLNNSVLIQVRKRRFHRHPFIRRQDFAFDNTPDIPEFPLMFPAFIVKPEPSVVGRHGRTDLKLDFRICSDIGGRRKIMASFGQFVAAEHECDPQNLFIIGIGDCNRVRIIAPVPFPGVKIHFQRLLRPEHSSGSQQQKN